MIFFFRPTSTDFYLGILPNHFHFIQIRLKHTYMQNSNIQAKLQPDTKIIFNRIFFLGIILKKKKNGSEKSHKLKTRCATSFFLHHRKIGGGKMKFWNFVMARAKRGNFFRIFIKEKLHRVNIRFYKKRRRYTNIGFHF